MRTGSRKRTASIGASLVMILCAAFPAFGDDSAAGTISLTAQGMDIREILTMFSRAGEISIVSGPEIVGPVSLNLLDVPFEEALDAVITMAGFQIVRKGGIYFVHSPPVDDLKSIMLREVSTHRLDYAQVEDIRIIIQDMLSPVGKATAYSATRTLIIEDRPDILERAAFVVRTLDIPPRQVLIEARIIEARMSDDMRFGIDWSLLFSSGKGSGDVLQSGFSAPANSGSEGLFITWGEIDFAAAIQSLEGVEELNTVASPRLLVVDGKEAQIIIGGQLGFSVVTTVENTVIQSVQFLDTGAQLRLTPTIAGDGFIQMKIHPEISSGLIDEGLPSKTTAEVTTEVLVKDGQTLLIGGLIRERDETTSKGIPFLRRIPVVGKLFGSTTSSKSRSEMITLITPRILAPGETVIE